MIGLEQWRGTIGLFTPRNNRRSVPQVSPLCLPSAFTPRCVLWSVFVVALLAQCGDIESNPGPRTSQTKTRQATLASDGSIEDASPSLSDIMGAIKSLTDRFDGIDRRLSHIDTSLTDLKEQSAALQRQVNALAEDNEQMGRESHETKEKIKRLEAKLEDAESRSRRNNLIFHGLPKSKPDETWEECEMAVKEVINKHLNISDDLKFDRAHRLRSSKGPPPIIVRFTYFKDKERVLKERTKLKDTNIFVNEDFTMSVRDTRRKLAPFLNWFRADGKRASLVFDHLIVDGERFNLDPSTQTIFSTRRSLRYDAPPHRPAQQNQHHSPLSQRAATPTPAGAHADNSQVA